MTRREFIGAGATALAGCAAPVRRTAASAMPDFIWAVMFKLGGNNMAGDAHLTADWPKESVVTGSSTIQRRHDNED